MAKISHHLAKLAQYQHRQYVILSAVFGLLVIALAFNRFVFGRSTVILHIAQPNVKIQLDGANITTEQTDSNTYRFTTLPGKHTLSITTDGAVNYKSVIETKAGRTEQLTPTLTIAPDESSDQLGTVAFSAYNPADKNLYYLGEDGKTAIRYSTETGAKSTLTDPVFRDIDRLSWSSDYQSVIVRDSKDKWYLLDFRKANFVTVEFRPIGGATQLDIQYDPTTPRVGFIDNRSGTLVFGVADPALQNETVLTKLDNLHHPRFTWSPNGSTIVLLDDTSYGSQNTYIYNLATNTLTTLAAASNIDHVVFSPDGQRLILVNKNQKAQLYRFDTNQLSTLPELIQTNTATWLSNTDIVAIIRGQNSAELVTIKTDSTEVVSFAATPKITGDVVSFYVNTDKKDLYYVSNKYLYTFPLLNVQ